MKKLKFILTLVFTFLLLNNSFSQKSVWGGFAYQDDRQGIASSYPMLLEMKQSGDKFKGTTLFFLANDPSVYVKMKFKGEMINNEIILTETEITDCSKINGQWLTKEMTLKFESPDNEDKLVGSWVATESNINFGRIVLKKSLK